MCGIAGYQGMRPPPPARIDACLALMKRRGPDHRAARNWVHGAQHTVLLHSRLSIIDLDPRANQPMDRDGGCIVFNGELYNYIERRRDLEAGGLRMRTSSDTEVMLAGLMRFGPEFLDRCEGMWAFALLDEKTGALSLVRDRFGEKPLYVLRTADGTYFGSEVKFIAALAGRSPAIDYDHLWRYLVNGYKALYKVPQTFFRDVTEVPSGTIMRLEPGAAPAVTRFWQPRIAIDPDMSFEQAVAGAREALVRSMELRLRSDVPLAFCMSGGVDSVALISIAKQLFGYDVHGFTIVNTDARYEESDMIDVAVRELGVRHTPVPLRTDGFLPGLRTLIRQHDAPVYTITYYVHWLLMEQIAAAGYRIAVSGTAADEIFSGYYDHHLAFLQAIRADTEAHAAALAAWQAHVRPIVRNPFLRDPDLFVRDPGFRDHIYLDAEGFAAYLKKPWREAFAEERYTEGVLRNRMLNELLHESVPVILHEDDLNAMYYSIENRSPFLDRPLVEFCNSIPTRHLMHDGKAKVVLREAMRGIAPDAILDNRRKVGFNAPLLDLLDAGDPAVRAEVLSDSPIYDHVDRDRIGALMEKGELPNSQSKFLFYFLNCKMFAEEFGG